MCSTFANGTVDIILYQMTTMEGAFTFYILHGHYDDCENDGASIQVLHGRSDDDDNDDDDDDNDDDDDDDDDDNDDDKIKGVQKKARKLINGNVQRPHCASDNNICHIFTKDKENILPRILRYFFLTFFWGIFSLRYLTLIALTLLVPLTTLYLQYFFILMFCIFTCQV